MLGDRIGQHSPNWWKLNSPGAMQGQHQPAANHITQPAVRLYPVPGLAEFLGQAASTRPRVLSDQLTNEIDIGFTDYPMPVSKCDAHARQRSNLPFRNASPIAPVGLMVLILALLLFSLRTHWQTSPCRRRLGTSRIPSY